MGSIRAKAEWLLPLFASVAVLVVTAVLHSVLGFDASAAAQGNGNGLQLLWAAAVVAVICASIWGAAASAHIVWAERKSLGLKTRRWFEGSLVVLSLLTFGAVLRTNFSATAGPDILETLPSAVDRVVAFANALATGSVILVVTACCLLSTSPGPNGTDAGRDASFIARRSRLLLLLLYSGAVLLLLALGEIDTLYCWVALKSGGSTQLASRVTASAGIIFTLLLVAIYAPAALIQAGWVDVLARQAAQAAPDFDREKWLVARGLEMSPLRSLGAGAAVIAPAVAGLLAAVFKH